MEMNSYVLADNPNTVVTPLSMGSYIHDLLELRCLETIPLELESTVNNLNCNCAVVECGSWGCDTGGRGTPLVLNSARITWTKKH